MKNTLQREKGLGYLVWPKIPYDCLRDENLRDYLERDLSAETAHHLREIHTAKGRILSAIRALSKRGIERVRTGLSWAEWDAPQGPVWIEWYLRKLAERFDVLPNLAYTSPRESVTGRTNAPPRDLLAYPKFAKEVIQRLGHLFREVELWNEPDLVTDWDPRLDPRYEKFRLMIVMGALVARSYGKKTVFGGVSGVRGVDEVRLLRRFARSGMMRYIDSVGFHNLRGTWSDDTPPDLLSVQAARVRKAASLRPSARARELLSAEVLDLATGDVELRAIFEKELKRGRRKPLSVHLTEYGFPPYDPLKGFSKKKLELMQVAIFANGMRALLEGAVERVYWYTYRDLVAPSLRMQITNFEDELQHHYGDTRENGRPKLLGSLLDEGGPMYVLAYANKHDLWPLVDKASLKRKKPWDYVSQSKKANRPA